MDELLQSNIFIVSCFLAVAVIGSLLIHCFDRKI